MYVIATPHQSHVMVFLKTDGSDGQPVMSTNLAAEAMTYETEDAANQAIAEINMRVGGRMIAKAIPLDVLTAPLPEDQ